MSDASIGAMRRRFALEALVRTPDGSGGAFETWTEIADLWGALEEGPGDERYASGRIEGRLTHNVLIRARADIAPGHRLRYGLRIFDIRAVMIADERHRRMRILCTERDL